MQMLSQEVGGEPHASAPNGIGTSSCEKDGRRLQAERGMFYSSGSQIHLTILTVRNIRNPPESTEQMSGAKLARQRGWPQQTRVWLKVVKMSLVSQLATEMLKRICVQEANAMKCTAAFQFDLAVCIILQSRPSAAPYLAQALNLRSTF